MSEMIWEDVQQNKWPEHPLQCCVELPSLLKMASYRVCQMVWRQYLSAANMLLTELLDTYHEHKKNMHKLVESMQLPKTVNPTVKEDLEKIRTELTNWVHHLKTDLFSRESYGFETSDNQTYLDWYVSLQRINSVPCNTYNFGSPEIDLGWCEWLANGEIDYRNSIRNMLRADELSVAGKFIAVSEYCMEDEIKSISLRSLPSSLTQVKFEVDAVLFYWIGYLKNDLRSFSFQGHDTSDLTMAELCFNKYIGGFEYFWNRLSDRYKIHVAKRCLRHVTDKRRWNTLERLMSSIPLASVDSFSAVSHLCIENCFLYSDSSQHPLRMWHRFGQYIPDSEFYSLIKNVFHHRKDCETDMRALVKIWWSAHDSHNIEYVAQKGPAAIVGEFANSKDERPPCPAAFNLVYEILSWQSEDNKRILMEQFATGLSIQIHDVESWHKLLDSCLPNANAVSSFKEIITSSENLFKMCLSYLRRARYSALDARLQWLLSERSLNTILSYKKQLLAKMNWKDSLSLRTLHNRVDKWNELSDFIDRAYGADVKSAFETKHRIIQLAIPVTEHLQCLNEFKASLPLNPQTIEEYYCQLIDTFQLDKLNGLMGWYSSDDSKVLDFAKLTIRTYFASNPLPNSFERMYEIAHSNGWLKKAYETPELEYLWNVDDHKVRTHYHTLIRNAEYDKVAEIVKLFALDQDDSTRLRSSSGRKMTKGEEGFMRYNAERIRKASNYADCAYRPHEMISWCTSSEVKLAKFKSMVTLDELFRVIVSNSKASERFSSLNKVLKKWYPRIEDRVEYKMQKLRDYPANESMLDALLGEGKDRFLRRRTDEQKRTVLTMMCEF